MSDRRQLGPPCSPMLNPVFEDEAVGSLHRRFSESSVRLANDEVAFHSEGALSDEEFPDEEAMIGKLGRDE